MGTYLGQLPPAELARLKAELAETLVANFCYPRFFDYRTESLRTRPVDRSKRQDVWLYLSSFDFTAWNNVDLTSPEFQRNIEGLFIQFVQRNRSFFGEQGRKRMSDIRMLINTSSSAVVQGLRTHLTNPQQQLSFGSPRPTISWSASNEGVTSEPSWEQIATGSLQLQQQLQELRGEVRPAAAPEMQSANGAAQTRVAGPDAGDFRAMPSIETTPTSPMPPLSAGAIPPSQAAASAAPPFPEAPAASSMQRRQPSPPVHPSSAPAMRRPGASGGVPSRARPGTPFANPPVSNNPAFSAPPVPNSSVPRSAPVPVSSQSLAQAASTPSVTSGQREMLPIGEDDVAIFEQMRHQLLVWLRVEAIRAGLEISGQNPAQLFEALRQQARLDETRLQIVSTLLNLANQVMKTRMVSILDYKQALMFHLMHTKYERS